MTVSFPFDVGIFPDRIDFVQFSSTIYVTLNEVFTCVTVVNCTKSRIFNNQLGM